MTGKSKITLEQFRKIKYELLALLEEADEKINYSKPNIGYDVEAYENELLERYYKVEQQLLNYDLSEITFEEWEDISIIADENHRLDFTGTNANIDFALIEYGGYCKFTGCNIRNVHKATGILTTIFDENTKASNSLGFLSDNFRPEFQEKFYNHALTISDLVALNSTQLSELLTKDYLKHFVYGEIELLFELLGVHKIIELYKQSPQEYHALKQIFNNYHFNLEYDSKYFTNVDINKFLENIKKYSVNLIKEKCFEFERQRILLSGNRINVKEYPEMFINANADIFLLNDNIPDEVRQRYYSKELTLQDIIQYKAALQNINIDNYINYRVYVHRFFKEHYGLGVFQELVWKYPDVFTYIAENFRLDSFESLLKHRDNAEMALMEAVILYVHYYEIEEVKKVADNIVIPDWLKKVGLEFVDSIKNKEELMKASYKTFIFDKRQRVFFNELGIENVKKFDQELGFFSKNNCEMLTAFLNMNDSVSFSKRGIDFKGGDLTYDEFLNEFANCLDVLRAHNLFADYPSYDWIEGDFRNRHPEIFMDKNAPEDLKIKFYRNRITPELLHENRDYIPYLLDKNINNLFAVDIKLLLPSLIDETGKIMPSSVKFIEEYSARFGLYETINILAKYGSILNNISIVSFHNEIEDEILIEDAIKKAIYNKILRGKVDYSYLSNVPDFKNEHPELFVDFSLLPGETLKDIKHLEKAFYDGKMSFGLLRSSSALIEMLKDKNLYVAFRDIDGVHGNDGRIIKNAGNKRIETFSDLELLQVFGNEKFLTLCSNYGRYLNKIGQLLSDEVTIVNGNYVLKQNSNDILSFEQICEKIEKIILREFKLGNVLYAAYDAPDYLKEQNPELFLSPEAPNELKYLFYTDSSNNTLTFTKLNEHRDWLPFLEGKAVDTALLKNYNMHANMQKYFDIFGTTKGIKLGINRAETVEYMIKNNKVELMKSWYDKTGCKFIPDYVVMQNFSLDDADKFLISGSNWSLLMKNKNFVKSPEAREAMLKIAYIFGAFDQDSRGLKKVLDLLNGLPLKIGSEYEDEMSLLKDNIQALNVVGVDKNVMITLYKKDQSGNYILSADVQKYPKESAMLRTILEGIRKLPIINPQKAHQLFGSFQLRYDPEFREFLLNNLEEILNNPDYITHLGNIQKQFVDIKAVNSNRVLTLQLALSYVQSNKYENIGVGNQKVSEIAAIAGYSQTDFETLQQIYNYGKQRTVSSIPRIENTYEQYSYEILRLDDPLAMAIGTLTNCCQELNNAAEVCMEHSMVDKNGRIFVIRDDAGNLVSQSWVWRNKDVLCFDNIEIPDKAFTRASRTEDKLNKKAFAEAVYQIYLRAAKELIEQDEIMYKELLDSGQITQEQYDGLRLGKITVGLGYNDIAEAIVRNAKADKSNLARPLPYESPVLVNRGLYTNDSTTQYILEERSNRKEIDGPTLAVYYDRFIEYTDDNFKERELYELEKLEVVTKQTSVGLETAVGDFAEDGSYVKEIAYNYNLDPISTKIVMNPNFAIIYEIKENEVIIADLLFNTIAYNGNQKINMEPQVIMQINLALEQIANGKKINIKNMKENQMDMFKKASNLTNELDAERGLNNGV